MFLADCDNMAFTKSNDGGKGSPPVAVCLFFISLKFYDL